LTGKSPLAYNLPVLDDQDKALQFYTNVLGFVKKTEIPMGAARCLCTPIYRRDTQVKRSRRR
jgi:hypothetical protein